jgi:hypothetical protein
VGVLGLPGGGGLVGGVLVWRSLVADLAVQRLAVCPQAEPSVAGAVAYRVGRQFVRGGDDVVDPLPREPGLGGVRSDGARSAYSESPSKACSRTAVSARGSVSPGPESVLTGDHQPDAGQAVEAEPGEPGGDLGQALQGDGAGFGQHLGGVGDHPGAEGVDEGQGAHVDRDVAVKADGLGQGQRERLFGLVVDLAGYADTGRGVLRQIRSTASAC